MNSHGIRKNIDMLGRITIPKPFRISLGMDIGDEIEICQTDEGILLRKPTESTDNKESDTNEN